MRETGGVLVKVQKLFVHPKYKQLKHDVGLFKLVESLTFSDSIKAVKLPRRGQAEATAGTAMTISGWGRVKPVRRMHKNPANGQDTPLHPSKLGLPVSSMKQMSCMNF